MSRHLIPTFASRGLWLLGLVLAYVLSLAAKQPASANTQSSPDSSQPRQRGTPSSTKGTTTTFIGYATNRSFFFPDIATSPGPLTAGGRLKLFVDQSISPAYVLTAALSAAFNQARNVPEGYGQGWNAYGSRFERTWPGPPPAASLGLFYSPLCSIWIPASSLRASLLSGAA